MTQRERILLENLGQDKIEALRKVLQYVPEFQLTGSAALVFIGAINRPIKDIDIEIRHPAMLDLLMFTGVAIEIGYSDDDNHYTFKINEISFCAFVSNLNKREAFISLDKSTPILSIGGIKNTISAKEDYVKRLESNPKTLTPRAEYALKKHKEDLRNYYEYIKNASVCNSNKVSSDLPF